MNCNGRSRIASTRLNTATVPPMPKASDRMAVRENAGFLSSWRNEWRRGLKNVIMRVEGCPLIAMHDDGRSALQQFRGVGAG